MTELGFNVIHRDIDFFTNNFGDIIVSNPPFSKSKEILTRLKILDKPFILILPSQKINTSYIRNLFMGENLQIIIFDVYYVEYYFENRRIFVFVWLL